MSKTLLDKLRLTFKKLGFAISGLFGGLKSGLGVLYSVNGAFSILGGSMGIVVGWATVIGLAIGAGVLVFDMLTTSVAEAKESLEEFNQVKSDLESTQGELEGISAQIEDIQSKGKLSITDEKELFTLRQEKEALEEEVALLEKKAELTGQKSNDDAIKAANNSFRTARFWSSFGLLNNPLATAEMIINDGKELTNEQILDLLEIKEENIGLLNQITGDSPEAEAARKKLQDEIDRINSFIYTVEEAFRDTEVMVSNVSEMLGDKSANFDKYAQGLLKLAKDYQDGLITFEEYISKMSSSIEELDLTKTFGDNTDAMKAFFVGMNEKGMQAIKDISSEYRNGEISLNDYIGKVQSLGNYFSSLGSKVANIEGLDPSVKTSIEDNISSVSDLIEELKTIQSILPTIQGSFEDFRNKPVSAVNDLVDKMLDLGITAKDIGLEATASASNMATALRNESDSFAKAQVALASKTQQTIANIGSAIGSIITGIKSYLANFKVKFKFTGNPLTGDFGFETDATGGYSPSGQDKMDYADALLGVVRDENGKVVRWAGVSGIKGMEYYASMPGYQGGEGYSAEFQSAHNVVRGMIRSGQISPDDVWATNMLGVLGGIDFSKLDVTTDDTPEDKDTSTKSIPDPEYSHPTDTILNGLNLTARQIGAEADKVSVNIDKLLEAEDYDSAIQALNDYIFTKRRQITALQESNVGISKEADNVRKAFAEFENGTYKDINTDEWFNEFGEATVTYENFLANAPETHKKYIEDMFGALQKLKQGWIENGESIVEINKDISDSLNTLEETTHKSIDKAYSDIERLAEREKDINDKRIKDIEQTIEKQEALLGMTEKYFDATNKVTSTKREYDKAIAETRISTDYLNEDEYARVFNEEDYANALRTINSVQGNMNSITNWYYSEIASLKEDELWRIEEITAEYERQIAAEERRLEIAEAELDVKKAQLELENVLAEKNVRYLDENGKWTWIADTDKVKQAEANYIDARGALEDIQTQDRQQRYIASQQRIIDSNNTHIGQLEYRNTQIDEKLEALSLAIEDIKDPIGDFNTATKTLNEQGVPALSSAVADVVSALHTFKLGLGGGGSTSGHDAGGHYGNPSSGGKPSPVFSPADPIDTVASKDDSNKTFLDKVGDFAKALTGGYASGTRSAKAGLKRVNENGDESYIGEDGTFHMFAGGEPVFNAEQTSALWTMSKLGASGILNRFVSPSVTVPKLGASVNDNSNHLNGDIVIQHVNNLEDFCNQLGNAFNRKNINLW